MSHQVDQRYTVRTFCLSDKGATVGEVVFADLNREQKKRIDYLARHSPDVCCEVIAVRKES